MKQNVKVGVIVVVHDNTEDIVALIDSLNSQKKSDDLIVLIDNHLKREGYRLVKSRSKADYFLAVKNSGFANACNLGAKKIKDKVDVLLFINPDTVITKGLLDGIREGAIKFDLWMPMILLPDGSINAAENVVHISGLSWAQSKFRKPPNKNTKIISFISGACMAVNKNAWIELGGMEENFFLYYEDTDFSARASLAGYKIGLMSELSIIHNYDFKKREYKFYYLERNRILFIIRTWPSAVIILLSPILFTTEIALVFISIFQKRFKIKLSAMVDAVKLIPWALKSRKKIQASSKMSSYEFLGRLSPEIENPYLNDILNSKYLNIANKAYYDFAKAILKFLRL